VTADEALAAHYGEANKPEKAEDFLRYGLANGPVAATKINEMAEGKHPWVTVRRAKAKLGIVSKHSGFGPGSEHLWALPNSECLSAPNDG
jgi:hypothetical protein